MRRYSWLVLTNCAPGKEAEYNKWYDEVHLPDLKRIPGVVDAYRGHLSDIQMVSAVASAPSTLPPYQFLSIYKLQTDDVQSVFDAVRARSGTADMEISPHIREAFTLVYEEY